MQIKAQVEVILTLGDDISFEQAQDSLLDCLYDSLCRTEAGNFWINKVEQID